MEGYLGLRSDDFYIASAVVETALKQQGWEFRQKEEDFDEAAYFDEMA
jgi:hypothetical protein